MEGLCSPMPCAADHMLNLALAAGISGSNMGSYCWVWACWAARVKLPPRHVCPVRVPTHYRYINNMGRNMEGNWDMLQQAAAEKPIVTKGTGTYKRTFPLDHITGKVLIRGAASENEVLLEQSSGKYTGIKLMRGLWEEPTGHSSGTFFPVAAPAGVGVLWGSAGHCLMPASVQQKWRCGYGTDVLTSSLSTRPVPRAIVDLGWITAGRNVSELAEHIPSQPSQRIGEAEVLPDFGFMVTKAPEGGPMQIFIPSARKLVDGDAVCVLGFAHRLTAEWAQRFLRTEADYEQAAHEAELLGHHCLRQQTGDWMKI
eukprot:gene9583-biopygen5784